MLLLFSFVLQVINHLLFNLVSPSDYEKSNLQIIDLSGHWQRIKHARNFVMAALASTTSLMKVRLMRSILRCVDLLLTGGMDSVLMSVSAVILANIRSLESIVLTAHQRHCHFHR